jgi:hypothetical protein
METRDQLCKDLKGEIEQLVVEKAELVVLN